MKKVPFFKNNPAFLTQEQLCRSFVVRQLDLELLVERIRENTGASCQHLLVIGARGMGKTTLVLRVAAEIEREQELDAQWYPIRFNEESYEVSSAAEFWLEALRHLSVQTGLHRWKEAYHTLRRERDETRLLDQALARLLDYADERDKRLLLIVENLNMLLGSQLSDDDGWELRYTLLNERRIMLLATATSRFDDIDDADKAFYDLLQVHELEPLDTAQCSALWNAVSGGKAEGTRIRPIEILTGGNPRLLAILASFASQGSLSELIDDLEGWVDDHTSYFKATLEALSPLDRKVYVTLANLWSPATSSEVAEAARMAVNKASAVLSRLRKRGAVTEQRSSGPTRFQIAERMYNIYYLMRQRSDRGDRVRAVVDFMTLYYDRKAVATSSAVHPTLDEERSTLASVTTQTEQSARQVLTSLPDKFPVQHTLACVLLETDQISEAFKIAQTFPGIGAARSEHFRDIIDFFARAAAAGHGQRALDLLDQSAYRMEYEPLIVALMMQVEKQHHAPLEVVEIAKDIVNQIDGIKHERQRLESPTSGEQPAP